MEPDDEPNSIENNKATYRILSGGARVAAGNLIVIVAGAAFWIVVGLLLGPEIVGVSSSVLSAATIASVLGGLSLSISILRLYMEYGKGSIIMALAFSILGTMLVALLVASLASNLLGGELREYSKWILMLAVALSTARLGQASLVACGCERFYTIVVGVGQVLRLGVGLVLGYMIGVKGVLVGLLLGPLTIALLGVSRGISSSRTPMRFPSLKGALEVARVGVSNYPFMISTQVMVPLTVIFTAYMTGTAVDTGVFYIMLNIILAIGMPMYSVATVGIPRSVELMDNTSLWSVGRVVLALILPLTAVTMSGPDLILSFFGSEYVMGSSALTVLALSIPAQAGLILGVSYLNVIKGYARVLSSGIAFLVVLPAASLMLEYYSGEMYSPVTLIAVSYVVASYMGLLATLLKGIVVFVLKALLATVIAGMAGMLVSILVNSLLGVVVSFSTSIILVEILGLSTIGDMREAVKIIVLSVFR